MSPRRIPAVAFACAALALIHGVIWSVVQPSLQSPDEPSHVVVVDYIAETGKLPDAFAPGTDPGLSASGARLASGIGFSVEGAPVWSPGQAAATQRALRRPDTIRASGGLLYRKNPPLFYVLQAAVVRVSGADLATTRLLVMRLVSSLWAAIAAFFVVLFIRELLPTRPWAWALGGVTFAFHPLTGFLGGGVNPEIMAAALGTVLLWLVARAFRRGLTIPLAAGVAVIAAAGVLTRVTFFGLLPGVVLAVALAAWRTRAIDVRTKLLALGAGALVFLVIWGGVGGVALDRPLLGPAGATGSSTPQPGVMQDLEVTSPPSPTVAGFMTYVWQFYLPRLPFMGDQFERPPNYPLYGDWVVGFVGRFGWFQYDFPDWVYAAGALFILTVLLAAARAMLARGRLRRRGPELACYGLMLAGTLIFIHYAGYTYRLSTTFNFEQARYLAPLFALYPALIAAAMVALRQRWRRIGSGVLGGLVIGHAVAAVLLTVQRYYV